MFVKPLPPSQVAETAQELGALEAITLKCLEKSPDDRYASMDDVVLAIDQLVELSGDDGTPPTPSRSWSPDGDGGGGGPPRRSGASSAWPHPRDGAHELELPTFDEMRQPLEVPGAGRTGAPAWAWVAVAVVTSAALAILGAAYWQGSRDPAPAANAPVSGPAVPAVSSPPAPPPAPAPGAPPVRSGQAAAPPAPGVGERHAAEGAPAGSSPAPRKRPIPPEAPRVGSDLDDVGDPFAAKH